MSLSRYAAYTVFFLAILFLGMCGLRMQCRYDSQCADAYKDEGKPIVQAIASYRGLKGRCPETLSEIGFSAPFTRFGWWKYYRAPDGLQCGLSLGGDGIFFIGWDSSGPGDNGDGWIVGD